MVMVRDHSDRHRSHLNSGSQDVTHLDLYIIASQFQGIALVQRHRKIYRAFQAAWGASIHALQIHAYTPEEWHKRACP